MRRRSARASGPLKAACASWLSNRKLPRVGGYRPTSRRATVLLPQPDSPTRASVWPFSIVKSTPSTACSSARGLRSSTRLSPGGGEAEGEGRGGGAPPPPPARGGAGAGGGRGDGVGGGRCSWGHLGRRGASVQPAGGAGGAGGHQVRALAAAAF